MESIQLAQMLADLSDLNTAQEAQAAVALVNANKAAALSGPTSSPAAASDPTKTSSTGVDQAPVRPGQRHHQRVGSTSSIISRTASPAKFDRFGRRIMTPPMTRTNSSQGSIPGTPRREAAEVSSSAQSRARSTDTCTYTFTRYYHTPIASALLDHICHPLEQHVLKSAWTKQPEDDVDRANSLMALYDIRNKLKEQDNTSLNKLREKILALQQTRHQAEKRESGGGGSSSEGRQSRFAYPKSPA
ncbi:hypothetical protein B0T24DRAFT_587095 [Lasiosphaeria ovina]|uniref:Uncharacterized protein n=1 Tax=Lasiosphaeria ovina TaxID=92902 RepID=A0AAE0TWM2_9PEZI|nr:hypothetical protein B0T24DRAFT_587095 [Lasiosphaeria ovina]